MKARAKNKRTRKHRSMDLGQIFWDAVEPTRLGVPLLRVRYAWELLLERRFALFLWVDGFLIFIGLFAALEGGDDLPGIYRGMVLHTTIFFVVPILANTVALERRAGSLDLALAVSSTEVYFLRRVLPVCAVFVVQGTFLMQMYLLFDGSWLATMTSLGELKGFLLLHLHLVEVCLLLGAISLFWASRLATTGGVIVGSGITVAVLYRWITDPLAGAPLGMAHRWLGIPVHLLALVWGLALLPALAAIFYLYARERLRRPETMLA